MDNPNQLIKLQLKNKSTSIPFPESLYALYKEAARHLEDCQLSSQHRFYIRDRPLLTDSDILAYRNQPNLILQIKNIPVDPRPAVLALTPNFSVALWNGPGECFFLENCQVSLVCAPILLPGKNPRILGGETHIEVDPFGLSLREFSTMQVPRYNFAWCSYAQKLFVVGGVESKGYSNVCEVYDLEQNTWMFFDSHPGKGRSGMSAVCWISSLFCFGGFDGIEYSDSIMLYRVLERFWVNLSLKLPFSSYYIGVADVGEGILITGGKGNRCTYMLCPMELSYARRADLPERVGCTRIMMRPSFSRGSIVFANQELQIFSYNLKTDAWTFEDDIK